jgi:Protein of unknown function (DUF3168)
MSGPVDFTALVVAHLKADENIDAYVGGNRLPERTTLPAIRVATGFATAAAAPTPEWWDGLVQVDCYAVRDTDSFELAAAVQTSLQSLVDPDEGVVVADVTQGDIRFVDDADFVPVASRHIVTVDITARATTQPNNP